MPKNEKKIMVVFEVETQGLPFDYQTKTMAILHSDLPAPAIISVFIQDPNGQTEFPFLHIKLDCP